MSEGQQRHRLEQRIAEHGGDPLVCALCGKQLLRLGSHLRRTHHLSLEQYRAQIGLAHTAPVERLHYRRALSDAASGRDSLGERARDDLADSSAQRERALSQRAGMPAAAPSLAAAERARTRNEQTTEQWQAQLDERARALGYRSGDHAIALTRTMTAIAAGELLGLSRLTVARLRGDAGPAGTRTVRIPVGLHEDLAALAAERSMSTTAYVNQLLTEYLRSGGQPGSANKPARLSTERLAEMYLAEGRSLAQIGEAIGLTPQAVWLRLRKAGVTMRSRHKQVDIAPGQVEELRSQGLSLDEIADRLRVSQATVVRRLRTDRERQGWVCRCLTTPYGIPKSAERKIGRVLG